MKLFSELEKYRAHERELAVARTRGNDYMGMFVIPSPIDGAELRVIASNLEGWEHASVSRAKRCPNWPEMDFIKRLFWHPHETAMQLHVPDSDHISFHPNCLHIWRPSDGNIPRPPNNLVGPDSSTPEKLIESLREAGYNVTVKTEPTKGK